MKLVVATYNVRHCRGLDGVVSPQRTAATISALGADIVALQEVDRGMHRSGNQDQPALLSDTTDMHVRFFPTLRAGEGEYGLALLTRHALEARLELLPRVADEEPRGAVIAHTAGLCVIATHLARSLRARNAQTRALALLATDETGPVVVMGDLNQTGRGLRPLRAAGLTGGLTRATHGPRWRRRQIDHILAGGGAVVTDCWAVDSDASDHLPLAAAVELVSTS